MNAAQAAYNESHRKKTARQLAWAAAILGPASLPLAPLVVPGAAAIICGLVFRSISKGEFEKRHWIMALIGLTFGSLGFSIGTLFWLGLM
jgi:hypothetical protein